MTLREVVESLTEAMERDPEFANLPVYMAKDPEGNGFGKYWGDFDVQARIEFDEDVEMGQEDELVVILWPGH